MLAVNCLIVVMCCLLFVVFCFGVCCLLSVVCCLLFVVWSALVVFFCVVAAVAVCRCLLSGVSCLLSVVCCAFL